MHLTFTLALLSAVPSGWVYLDGGGETDLAYVSVDAAAGTVAKGGKLSKPPTVEELEEIIFRPRLFSDVAAMKPRALAPKEIAALALPIKPGWALSLENARSGRVHVIITLDNFDLRGSERPPLLALFVPTATIKSAADVKREQQAKRCWAFENVSGMTSTDEKGQARQVVMGKIDSVPPGAYQLCSATAEKPSDLRCGAVTVTTEAEQSINLRRP